MNELQENLIQELIRRPQYSLSYAEKQAALLPLLEAQVQRCGEAIPSLGRYLSTWPSSARPWACYADVPYLPVSVFKNFRLSAVPEPEVVRVLQSSATTTGVPSKIYLDKATAFRQAKAVAAILKDVLGGHKRPYLVLDTAEINQSGSALSARGAAARAFMPFASSIDYALVNHSGTFELSLPTLESFFAQHRDQPVVLSGFTYIIWMELVQKLRDRGVRFHHEAMALFHSGGWKRLTEMRVEKSTFNAGVAEVFGCTPASVRDFYGMVEQVGIIFVDCEAGNKHSPNFGEVLIRDASTLQPVEPGKSGLIEVLSVLPTSYPGQALLTADLGTLLGFDDCPCGRPGVYFRFQGRVGKAEIRGCGDVFAVSQVVSTSAAKPAEMTSPPPSSGAELLVATYPGAPACETSFPQMQAALLDELAKPQVPADAILELLDATGKNLAMPDFAGIEGIAFLSTWLRKANLRKVLQTDLDSSVAALDHVVERGGIAVRAAPRGIACHWVAGNVPTLALFSWAIAALTKNATIMRVPSDSFAVVQQLFRAVEHASAEFEGITYSGKFLLDRTRLVQFPSDDLALNHAMSLCADVRIMWGGGDAIRAISQYPRMDHCEDVIFGPKFSIGVMDAAARSDQASLAGVVRAFVRDTVAFDQAACSSPQVLFVEATMEQLEALADVVQAEFVSVLRRLRPAPIEPYAATRILDARAHFGLSENSAVRAPADLSYTILLEKGPILRDGLQFRTLSLVAVDDLMQVPPLLSPKIQTIGAAIADPAKRAAFAEAAALRGVSRIVRPGTMNFYEIPWDGMLPLSRLVRWCRV